MTARFDPLDVVIDRGHVLVTSVKLTVRLWYRVSDHTHRCIHSSLAYVGMVANIDEDSLSWNT